MPSRRPLLGVLATPRLVIQTLPVIVAVVLVKWALMATELQPLRPNPLLSGLVAAMVFLLGFLLAGTAADYKEAERLPGELAASLDTIADECLIIAADKQSPAAGECLVRLRALGRAMREWLYHDRPFDDVLLHVRALNEPFLDLTPLAQPGFVTRLKSEQAGIRKTLIRINAIRTTSFVAAGYVIAELTGTLLVLGLLLSEIGGAAESLFFTGVISLLMTYLFLLVRDLDNPFEYRNGKPGVADVSLKPLLDVELRLRHEYQMLDPANRVSVSAEACGTNDGRQR